MSPTTDPAPPPADRHPLAAPRLPSATYRLQFNRAFTFARAAELAPYLHDLGVSDLYASPYLQARPGSPHGYDITDHSSLNAEIGTAAEYDAMVGALRARGMGQVLDIVPNHMGIVGGANAWWIDVLENGPGSPYAGFFDIDWNPIKAELRNKVLLPVLGDQYGRVLESGELVLVFEQGAFFITYFDNRWPIAPKSFDQVLALRIEVLEAAIGADDAALQEYRSIITAVRNLPRSEETDPERVAERQREKEVIKRRLAALCAAEPAVRRFVEENVRILNGTPGDPRSFDRLDALLNAQNYRLSYWRVAADEINYRRFFDINDLAALRTENPEVFRATHRLVLRLVGERKVTGLRVDHPDGLHDPGGYFAGLQQACRLALAEQAPVAAGPGSGPPGAGAAAAATPAGRPVPERGGEAAGGGEAGGAGPVYLVAEKILGPGERLPESWPVHGTTGYDALNAINGLFVDATAARTFREVYGRFTGVTASFDDIVYEKKKLIMRVSLSSEVSVLGNMLNRISEGRRDARDFTLRSLSEAVAEIIACFPVYRTYITGAPSAAGAPHVDPSGEDTSGHLRDVGHPPASRGPVPSAPRGPRSGAAEAALSGTPAAGPAASSTVGRVPGAPGEAGVSERDRVYVEVAVARAKRRNPAVSASIFDFIRDLLLLRHPDYLSEADREAQLAFVLKFQQTTGPVAARGIEDTAFYVYNRLVSLNEVGGDPQRFGLSVAAFHQQNLERQARWPYSMTTLATHDTKRGEDTRARINVLSELPREWRAKLARWSTLNARHRSDVDGQPAPDRNEEYLLYQTLVGAWPPELAEGPMPPAELAAFRERIAGYMQKATKEAKVNTSWINPDQAWDGAVRRFVLDVLEPSKDNRFLDDFLAFQRRVAGFGIWNSLSQTLLKLAGPGVADTYQGTELWDFSLVDPDNRRPVDYERRRAMLARLAARARELAGTPGALARELVARPADGAVKLHLVRATLTFRRARPHLFGAGGAYVPLEAVGPMREHICAFARCAGREAAVVAVPRLVVRLLEGEERPPLGAGVWGDTAVVAPPGDAVGQRYRNVLTGETVEAVAGEGDGAVLPVAALLASFPVALLERVRIGHPPA